MKLNIKYEDADTGQKVITSMTAVHSELYTRRAVHGNFTENFNRDKAKVMAYSFLERKGVQILRSNKRLVRLHIWEDKHGTD